MLAGSFPRNIEAHPGSDHSCLPNHLSPSMRRSHLLQARRYEDILRSRPRVRARLRRTGPVPVFVLELRAAEGYQSNVCTLDFPTVLSVSKLIPRPPRPIIPRRTCSLASNGMPVMVEFAFFGIWALRPDSDVNRGRQSRTADRGALYKSSSRDFLGFFIRCQCGGLLPVDPVRRTLVLHQSAPDLHAGVAIRKLRYLLQAAFRRH